MRNAIIVEYVTTKLYYLCLNRLPFEKQLSHIYRAAEELGVAMNDTLARECYAAARVM